MTNEIKARPGDVLVVSYPEMKIPIPDTFGNITIGGLIYTRQLLDGDDVSAEFERIYEFLKQKAIRHGREKVAEFAAEVRRAHGRS